jgi:hypothetical protein
MATPEIRNAIAIAEELRPTRIRHLQSGKPEFRSWLFGKRDPLADSPAPIRGRWVQRNARSAAWG